MQVSIFEKLPVGSELSPGDQQPVELYAEPAFGFVRIPTKYSANALPLDRSNPFTLQANFERALPQGDYTFRLRARGAARLLVDGKEVAQTKALHIVFLGRS